MPNRLLTKQEWLDIWYSGDDEKHLKVYNGYLSGLIRQDAKTHEIDCKKFGEWLESKAVAVPLMGVEWHIRLDHIEALKRGEMPE